MTREHRHDPLLHAGEVARRPSRGPRRRGGARPCRAGGRGPSPAVEVERCWPCGQCRSVPRVGRRRTRADCASAIKCDARPADKVVDMTTAADTFAAFLDTLAETLDLGSDERAGRLHLSRFHLDHVVSATGGEPPERMRRRLLLERAAYRLLSGDQQVVDIAFEAGYGSHEAFTRAFARAYGRPRAAGVSTRPAPRSRARAACTSTRPAACGCRPPKGDTDGPDDAHDRAPRLADRRAARARPPGSPTSSSTPRSRCRSAPSTTT